MRRRRPIGDALKTELSHKWGMTAVVEQGFEASCLDAGMFRLGFADPALALRFAAESDLSRETGWPEEPGDGG